MAQIINTPGNDNTGTGIILGIILVVAIGAAALFIYPRLHRGGGNINVYNPPAQTSGVSGSVSGSTQAPTTGQ